jgi:hypothetical protein
MADLPTVQDAFCVSGSSLIRSVDSMESLIDDPRGICWIWEPPDPHAKYEMGLDPSVGITGWTRTGRVDNDSKIDNGAIEVFKIDAIKRLLYDDKGQPDIDDRTKQQKYVMADKQVAEFAAPVDAVEIARIACLLGRIYAGGAEEHCELIYESYPGPGLLTTQELLRLGYSNLWYWEYIDNAAEQTNRIGWRSWGTSQCLLWYRSRRHLMEDRAQILSPWLLAEYRDAVFNVEKARAQAAGSAHDDRMQAANMAFWAGHSWVYSDTDVGPVTQSPILDPQRIAPDFGSEVRSWRDRWGDVIDDWDRG